MFKKKVRIIISLLIILLMCVPSFASEDYQNEVGLITYIDDQGTEVILHPESAVEKELKNISNEEARAKLIELFSNPAYYEISSSQIRAFDDSKYLLQIKSLSKLSTSELDSEISKVVKQITDDNKTNSNIIWDKFFIDNYVKKYAPNNIKYLKISTPENIKELNESEIILRASVRTAEAYIAARNVAGDELFALRILTQFGYDGVDVLSLYPQTTGIVYWTGFYSYAGLNMSDSFQKIVSLPGGKVGDIKKHGLFNKVVPSGTQHIVVYQEVFGDGTDDYWGESY